MAKLDKIGFAELIAYCVSRNMTIDKIDIAALDNIVSIEVPEPVVARANVVDVNQLLMLMFEGQHKIEAIKVYRNMTNAGLKESKDAVERYWVSKPINW